MPSSSPPSPPKSPSNPRHGEFRNGDWLCNCEPRLVAKIRTGTTNTKNHGKRFYVCPKDRGRENTCDMFLLLEDAQKRTREYLKSNGRSEKRQTTLLESMTPGSKARQGHAAAQPTRDQAVGGDGPTSTRNRDEPLATGQSSTLKGGSSGAAASSTSRSAEFYDTTSDEDDYGEETKDDLQQRRRSAMAVTPAKQPTGAKRKRSSQDEDFLDELSSGGEEEWVAVTERSSRSMGRQGDTFITPSARRTTDVENGMATPSLTKGKSVKKVLFKDVDNGKRQRLDDDSEMVVPSSAAVSASVRLWGTDAIIGSTSSSSTSAPSESSTPRNAAAAAPLSSAPSTAVPSSSPPSSSFLPATAPPATLPATLPPTLPPTLPATLPPSSSPPTATPPLSRGGGGSADPASLMKDVMDILSDRDVAAPVRDEVARTLERHANLARGYERGRDAARKAVKEAEDRAARLQARVDELERSRQELRAQLMGMWGKL
ncbi:hypothetical protein F5Y14DRAFT_283778 [Nemania sp. NC0429]|nr:hypothetical protein F5Y14DRAFT_283778 [Nemania sp. NC0429]